MNKRKVKEIVKFSISKNFQNKWFIILNIFMLLTMILTNNLENINNLLESNNIELFHDDITIEVIDKQEIAKEKFEKAFESNEKVEIKQVDKNEYTKENIGDTIIVVELEKDTETIVKSKITSKEGVDDLVYDMILKTITEIRSELFAEENNISLEALEIMDKELNIERIMLGVDAENYDTKEMIKTVSTFLIYMISIFVFSLIANEIAQEKVSKSIEYVLTSVTEREYLLAKIVSVISLILLQTVYFVIYYVIGNLINSLINISQLNTTENINILSLVSGIDTEIILYILTVFVYGLLTLILMSIIQAAISSKTTNMSEAGNTIMLLTTITIFAYFFTLILITPYTNMTPIIYFISCLPLLSNYFVPAIMIIGQANPLLIIVSLSLLILSIPITFKICAKIFKNGVLDYNQKQKGKVRKGKVERTIKEEQEHKFKVSKYRKFSFVIGMTFIIYIVLQLIGQLLLGTLLVPLIKDYFTNTQVELIVMCLICIISLSLATAFMNMYKESEDTIKKQNLKNTTKIKIIFGGIFFLGVIQIILPYILEYFGINYTMDTVLNFETDNSILTNIFLFVTLAIQPAIFEELLFRKSLIDFSKKFGVGFAVIVSSIFFGLIHMNSMQSIFAFLVGLLFGIIYIKTGNIKLTILLHLLNNGYSSLLMIFSNNQLIVKLINIWVIAAIVFGFLIFLKFIITNKNKIKIKKIDKNKLEEYKFIFFDYTFIVSLVVICLLFSVTENMLIGM